MQGQFNSDHRIFFMSQHQARVATRVNNGNANEGEQQAYRSMLGNAANEGALKICYPSGVHYRNC